MSNIRIELNRTTRMLGRLFPAILAFTPAITSAGIIEQSTSVPQDFSADTEYVINKDVTISSSSNKAAVSVSGIDVTSVTNKGNISGAANGLDINTGAQRVIITNETGATISSTEANAVNIESMQGNLINEGNIKGVQTGIFISENSSTVNITNTATGKVEGNTGLSTEVATAINNEGTFNGLEGDGIALKNGNSKISNSGTITGTQNGIYVSGNAKVDITNSGSLGGGNAAVFFASDKNNTLVLNTGSSLSGDVISTVSKGNTLTLVGTGTEDSNFIGLNEGDGFASVKMNGEDWTLTGNVDIIGAGDSLQVNSGNLTLAGTVSNAGNTLVANEATLQLGNGEGMASLSGGLTNNGTVIFNQGGNFTFSTDMTGSGNVEKVDANTLTLTGNNSYTGDTTLQTAQRW